jgi:hypothetical protein
LRDDSLATARLAPANTAIGWGFLFPESTLYSLAVPNPLPDAYSIEPPILVSLNWGATKSARRARTRRHVVQAPSAKWRETMEDGIRHFYAKAMQAKQNNMRSEIVDHYMQKAIEVAQLPSPRTFLMP